MRSGRTLTAVGVLAVSTLACHDAGQGPEVHVTVPPGSPFVAVVDTLAARGLVSNPLLFRVYAKARSAEARVRSGRYAFHEGDGWGRVLDDLVAGRVQTVTLTIPEGFTLKQMAPRIAELSETSPAAALDALSDPQAHTRYSVPGPGLEGYLFPDTYRFASGTALSGVIETMAGRYRAFWTAERRARLNAVGLSEAELVTLASIVQAEARRPDEMPRIASVYHNRLDRGWRLEADPTVLYALGGPRERLLYAAIDSVANNPYNTYRQAGLPPGPIGAPGAAALEAALNPAGEPFLFFVARPDGYHTFTRTLAEHNRAKAAAQRAFREVRSDRPS
ncbi:MAG: endolytic transglycosylase MltG [Gemmatimonadota bacterium]